MIKVKFQKYFCLSLSLLIFGCVETPKTATSTEHGTVDELTNNPPKIKSVSVPNTSTFVVTGNYLDDIRSAKLSQSGNVFDLPVVSKSKNKLVLTVSSNVKVAVDLVYTLLISNAFGQASTPITFVINNNSITTAHIVDGAITSAKLDDMGAASGEVLLYNGSSWGPGNVSGLDYQGTYVPIAGTPPSVGPNDGDFYLVSTSISNVDIDAAGATPLQSYAAGDWLVYNSGTLTWDKISNTSSGNFLSKSGNDLSYTSGRLSLGISTPSTILTLGENSLMGTYSGEMLTFFGSDVSNGAWNRNMSFGINGTKHVKLGTYGSSLGGTSTLDYFYIDATGSATPWSAAKFVITSAGFVGVNNLSPTEEIDVTGTIKATNFVGDGSLLTGIVATDGLTNTTNTTINADSDSNASGQIRFQIAGSTVGVFDNNGRFGIGTTSPAESLSVVGNAVISQDLSVQQDIGVSGDVAITGNLSSVGNLSSSNLFIDTTLITTNSVTNRVGINTAAPVRTLDINGELKVECIYDSNNTTQIGGTCSSDERFKKNIENVEDISRRFKHLRLVNYDWNLEAYPEKKFSQGKSLGFIAQEVRKEFPELVEQDSEGMYKLNYSKLQLYSIGAVVEQAKEIQELKDENAQMKNFLCQKYPEAPFCQ